MPSNHDYSPSSTQKDEKQVLQEFHTKLEGFWEDWNGPPSLSSPQPKARFLNLQKFKQYMTQSVVGSLLKAVLSEEDLGDIHSVAISVKQKYLRLFAILLKLEEGRQICNFMRLDTFEDSKLPVRDETQPIDFPHGHQNFWEDFKRQQHCFFPFEFGNLAQQPKISQERILPFINVEKLQKGGCSTVNRVEVSSSFNLVPNRRDKYPREDRHNIYVLKQYTKSQFEHYENERKAYSTLQPLHGDSTEVKPGLIRFFGSFQHGDTYVIVLEWADCGSLTNFFRTVDPPTEPHHIENFWARILKLTSGLKTISTASGIKHRNHEYQGIHQDIKPDNILVCSDSEENDEFEFKLADLGTTHFSPKTSEDTVLIDHRGTREFGAPEAARDETNQGMTMGVTTKVDVWSLACVLSVTATWLLHSRRGIQKYERKRYEANQNLPHSGAFHDGAQVLEIVKQHHENLKADANNKGDRCTVEVISRIIELGLYNAGDRLSAAQMKSYSDGIMIRPSISASSRTEQGENGDGKYYHRLVERQLVTPPEDSEECVLTSPGMLSRSLPARASFESPRKEQDLNTSNPSRKKIPNYSFAQGLSWLGEWKDKKKDKLPHDHLRDDYLLERDHVFLVDRTATMKPHWQDVQNVVLVLSYIVKGTDKNGLDLYIMPDSNSKPLKYPGIRDSTTMRDKVRTIGALEDTERMLNIDGALGRILDEYCQRIRTAYAPRSPSLFNVGRVSVPKKLSLYVLTNGKWVPKMTGEEPIRKLINILREYKLPQNQVGIQFIQFGSDDSEATKKLQHLDSGLKSECGYDIVDTTPHDGNLWKMLVGGLCEWFDGDGEDTPITEPPNRQPHPETR